MVVAGVFYIFGRAKILEHLMHEIKENYEIP
jgi:hypothetical protein